MALREQIVDRIMVTMASRSISSTRTEASYPPSPEQPQPRAVQHAPPAQSNGPSTQGGSQRDTSRDNTSQHTYINPTAGDEARQVNGNVNATGGSSNGSENSGPGNRYESPRATGRSTQINGTLHLNDLSSLISGR
ncbi:hypothetical protein FQN54_002734 [Arachnomyces sp. PD_36]|nr:hypothetical protein FQN54_002734 [Arachnomyces sp. PD_36]